jgi:hypothetical protein
MPCFPLSRPLGPAGVASSLPKRSFHRLVCSSGGVVVHRRQHVGRIKEHVVVVVVVMRIGLAGRDVHHPDLDVVVLEEQASGRRTDDHRHEGSVAADR